MQSSKIVPKFKLVYLLWLLVPLLLWVALKDINWSAVGAAMGRLTGWQIVILIALNLATLLSFSGIWYLVLLGYKNPVSYFRLSMYRVASFGVSYFTPGPQFGGEPLQVYLLMRNHQIPIAVATAATALDKVLELFFNFLFLAVGLIFVSGQGSPAIYAIMALVMLAMLALFAAEWLGWKPLTKLMQRLRFGDKQAIWIENTTRVLSEIEGLIADFCRTQPHLLLLALGISLLSWALVLVEYWISLYFLGVSLSLYQLVVAVTINRLAFLVPLPGGLGALEGSQVLAMTMLGLDPALGVSQGLIIRARDILVGLVGLAIGWQQSGKRTLSKG